MRGLTWQGKRNVSVEDVSDPRIEEPTVDQILPLLTDDDPLGVDTSHAHAVPLEQAPQMYETFQKKEDGCVRVLLKP